MNFVLCWGFNEALYCIEMLVRAENGETLSIVTDYALLEAVQKDRGKDKKYIQTIYVHAEVRKSIKGVAVKIIDID